jgi:hypothetical protein
MQLAKMLRKIETAQSSFLVQPTTFGQYVTLLTSALKIKLAVVPSGPSADRSSYCDREHRFLKVGEETQWCIDRAIAASWEIDHPTSTLALTGGQ